MWIKQLSSFIKNSVPPDLFKSIFETFLTRIFLIIIGLTTSILVARSLGPEGRGLFAMTVVVGALGVQFGNLGFHSSNTFYVARDRSLLPPLLGNGMAVSFGFGSLVALLAGLFFFFFPDLAPVHGTLLIIGLAWIPLGLAYLLSQNLLIGIQEFRVNNKIQLCSKIFYVALIGLLILWNSVSPFTVFSGSFIALGLSFIWVFQKLRQHSHHSISLSKSLFARGLRYGFKAYMGSLFAFLLLRVDLLMINEMLGSKEAGFYDLAVNLANMVYILPNVVATILFPKLCALKNTRDKWIMSRNTGIILIIMMFVGCLALSLIAHPLLGFLYGSAFLPSAFIFIILMGSKLVITANHLFSNFIASVHVPWTAVPYGGFLCLLNIGLNLIFIKQYGMAGAAAASVICFGLLIPFNFYYSRKYLRSSDFDG